MVVCLVQLELEQSRQRKTHREASGHKIAKPVQEFGSFAILVLLM